MVFDINQPLGLTERVRLNRDESFDPATTKYRLAENVERIRILATDRICPADFSVVIGVYQKRALFGPEEFIYTVNPTTGSVSGQGLSGVYLINPKEEDFEQSGFYIYAPTPGYKNGPFDDLEGAMGEMLEYSQDEDVDAYVLEVKNGMVIQGYYTNMAGDEVNEESYNGQIFDQLT